MDNLKRQIEDSDMNSAQVLELQKVVNLKLRKVESCERDEAKRQAERKVFEPSLLLIREVIALMREHESKGWIDTTLLEAVEDLDYVWQLVTESAHKPNNPTRWQKVKESSIHCCADECWYLDMNPDRMDEHEHNYYHLDERYPRVSYCDVCVYNLNEDAAKDCIDHEMEWICKSLQTEIKKHIQ